MKEFVPGVDSSAGAGIPESLMRFSASGPESGPGDGDRSAVGYIALIKEPATTLIDKYRKLCYWRQVVNAENN